MRYLKPLSLCLNLSDITILSMYTKFKAIGFLDMRFVFINYSVTNLFTHFILCKKLILYLFIYLFIIFEA